MNLTFTSQHLSLKKVITSGVCLALCLLLPFLTGQIPQVGSMLCPMHIPVLICGLVCGWPYGLVVGLIAPVFRSLLFGMPLLFPTATAMAFELAAYGAMSGILYQLLPKKISFLYTSLIGAMLFGRIIWGIAMVVLMGISGGGFTFAAFIAGAFTNAVPGIICHILIIPPIVLGLKKAGLAD
ncbi:MAG: ECF transporter S component [Bacteroidaceae bacterium]|nr:ECF transporter S component [Bacteroidaceae bacterium]